MCCSFMEVNVNSPGEFCDSTLLPIAMCVINLCTVGFIQIRLCFLNTLLLQCFDAVGHATGRAYMPSGL